MKKIIFLSFLFLQSIAYADISSHLNVVSGDGSNSCYPYKLIIGGTDNGDGTFTANSSGGGGGGGAVSSVSNSDGTLTISPTTGNVVASIALGHANTWTANVLTDTTHYFSSPDSGTTSEKFGASATAAGNNSTALGNTASSSGTNSVAVGDNSSAGLRSVIVGSGATSNGDAAGVAVGYSAAIGNGGKTGGIAIGNQATSSGDDCIAIGTSSTAGTNSQSIAIGSGAQAILANQFVAGSSTKPINNVYFGKGYQNATPTSYTINGTGGTGSNISGGDLLLGGGIGTGTGVGGKVTFRNALHGTTGSSANTLADSGWFDESGNFNVQNLTASQILATDASKNLVSLAVATYPSLTELSYGKGVTSAIQTQIDSKASTNQTMFIGTTSQAINRASASEALTGITSIDGSAATLTTPRAIYGNNFDGSAALAQIIASTYGGTGNGFTKISGPTTSERTKTMRDASDTVLELGGSYTPTGTWTSLTMVTPVLGTPTSGTLTNCTIPDSQVSFTDITTGNSSTSNHGYLLKLDNNSAHFMNGQGSWATPAGGASLTYSTITADQTLAVNNAYVCNKGTLLTGTLPSTAAVGDTIVLIGRGAGFFKVGQPASTIIHIGGTVTTTGTGGSLTGLTANDSIVLVCSIANTDWNAESVNGNFTIA